MATSLGWVGVVCIVILFVCIVQSAVPVTPSGVVLGESCYYDRECTIPNSYCQQRTCRCKSGYRNNTKNDNCVKTPELGERCSHDEDCSYTREASRCADNVCKRCSEGSEQQFNQCTELVGGCAYHEYDGICFHYRRIGELCEVDEECWIYPHSNRTRKCVLAMCVCVQSHDTMSGPLPAGHVDQCIPKDSSATKCESLFALLSFTIVLTFIVMKNI